MTPQFDGSGIITDAITAIGIDVVIIISSVIALGVALLLVDFGWKKTQKYTYSDAEARKLTDKW